MPAFEKLHSFWPHVRRRAAAGIGAAAAAGQVEEKLAVDTLIAVIEGKARINGSRPYGLKDRLAAIKGLGRTGSNRALDYLLQLRKNVKIEIGDWEDVGNNMIELEPGRLYSRHACSARLEFPGAEGPLKKALAKKKRFEYYIFQATTSAFGLGGSGLFIPNKPDRKPDLTVSSFPRSRALRTLDRAIEQLGLPADQRRMLTIHEESFKKKGIPAEWKSTPYDKMRQEKIFDFFVSYKSEDVEIARLISELLIAGGFKVWFAEYTVGLEERQLFMKAINRGLRSSKYGILLTGKDYSRSRYCLYELEQLVNPGKRGVEGVLDIKLGKEPRLLSAYPGLKHIPTMDYTGNIKDVFQFIRQSTALPVQIPPIPDSGSGGPVVFRDKHLGYTLDVTGWQVTGQGGEKTPYGITGPECTKNFGNYQCKWNLIVGAPAPAPREIPRAGQVIDDRKCYNQAMDAARTITGRIKADCKGVHLMFSAGYSQLALTYWFHGYWTRRYSVILLDPDSGAPTEFAFVFAFFGPFREYCRCAHVMDRVVGSLQWK